MFRFIPRIHFKYVSNGKARPPTATVSSICDNSTQHSSHLFKVNGPPRIRSTSLIVAQGRATGTAKDIHIQFLKDCVQSLCLNCRSLLNNSSFRIKKRFRLQSTSNEFNRY